MPTEPQRFEIHSITAQKDLFRIRDEGDLGERGFLESDAKEAEVLHFKRFIVEATLHENILKTSVSFYIDVRGDICRFRVKEPGGHDAHEVFRAASHALRRYMPELHGVGPLTPAEGDALVYSCATPDALRLVAIFHEIREMERWKARAS